jgi:single-strand DNA-binding protein
MSKDVNLVQVIGHLGADPALRFTPQGAQVVTFSVAAGRAWTDRDGVAHEETEWFRCVAWDKLGAICHRYLSKGVRAYVEGRLKTRRYTDRDGVEQWITEVIAQDVILLDARHAPEIGDADVPVFDAEPEQAPAPAPARPLPEADLPPF